MMNLNNQPIDKYFVESQIQEAENENDSQLQSVKSKQSSLIQIKSKKLNKKFFEKKKNSSKTSGFFEQSQITHLDQLDGYDKTNQNIQNMRKSQELFRNSESFQKTKHKIEMIEEKKQLQNHLEQFILLFNQKPIEGIQYLIDNELIQDASESIANSIHHTIGLSKDALGKLFGAHYQRNQNILQSYINLIDYKEFQFDEGLRFLLSLFTLPTEFQQIERIIKLYAEEFQKDNPNIIDNSDTGHILGISILMLQTSLHNKKLDLKEKMTKPQFIKNTQGAAPTLTTQLLEQIYDRVQKTKFETQVDHTETIYKRLNKNLKNQELPLNEMINILQQGAQMKKFGKNNNPKTIWFYLSEEKNSMC